MKKIITHTVSFVSMIAMLAIAPLASANYSINSNANDCKTVSIGNYTTGEGINGACWTGTAISASAGQSINVALYYHNNGDAPANNVVFKLSNPQDQTVNGSVSFTGQIYVDGALVKSEVVSANITGGSAHLVLGNVMRYDIASHTNVPVSNGNSILTSSGLSFGALQPGWNNQGTIKVSFSVIGSADTNNQPIVATYNHGDLNNELGNVVLQGYFNGNGSDITTYFRYRKIGGSWNSNVATQNHGNTSGNISTTLTNLATGSYEYQACAQNASGTKCGNYNPSGTMNESYTVAFTIDRGNGGEPCGVCGCNGCYNDNLAVTTKSATSIDTDSAVLRGEVNNDGGANSTDVYFKWGTSSSNLYRTLNAGSVNSADTFSKNLSGLDNDTTYYFKACADNNNDSSCGSIKSFTTDSGNNNNNNNNGDLPNITTLGTVSVGSTVASVDGYYDANGCSVTTYFEYGRTSSLGSATAAVNRGNGSGSMLYSFTNLAPNTTYYYRAVGNNCEGTVRGSIRSFVTGGSTVVDPVVITTGGGSGNAFIKLMIDNHRDTVRAGSDIAYDVSWANVTRSTLKNMVLEIRFPDQMVVVDTDKGSIAHDGHSVIVEVASLGSLETGDMTVTTAIKGNLKDGDPVVAQAVMAFENPKTSATENAIAYDSDQFSTRNATGLGASLFGLSFLPGSLAGWLIILLIILLIIVLARHFMAQSQNKVVVNTAPIAPVTPPTTSGTNGNDYIVYRPTPKV